MIFFLADKLFRMGTLLSIQLVLNLWDLADNKCRNGNIHVYYSLLKSSDLRLGVPCYSLSKERKEISRDNNK